MKPAARPRGQVPAYLQSHKQKSYQPEYKRLDVEPMGSVIDPIHPELSPPNTAVRNFKVGPVAVNPRQQKQQQRLPAGASIPVQSGNGEDSLWVDGLGAGEQKRGNVKIIDNNDDINVDALQGYDQTKLQAIESQEFDQEGEVFNDEDVAVPVKATGVINENTAVKFVKPEETSVSRTVDEFLPGDYIVSCGGKTIVKSSDVSLIRQVVEDLVLTQNIDIYDIVVCKRISIDVGVILT